MVPIVTLFLTVYALLVTALLIYVGKKFFAMEERVEGVSDKLRIVNESTEGIMPSVEFLSGYFQYLVDPDAVKGMPAGLDRDGHSNEFTPYSDPVSVMNYLKLNHPETMPLLLFGNPERYIQKALENAGFEPNLQGVDQVAKALYKAEAEGMIESINVKNKYKGTGAT